MGAKGREIYHAVEMSEEDRKKPERIFSKVRAHIAPTLNPVFARYQFNNIVQGEKTMEQFIALVKNKAKDCDFGALKDDLIRDRIIFGVSSTKLREKLLQVGKNLKMDKCVTMCQEFEYSASQMKIFDKDTSQVHALSKSNSSTTRTYSQGKSQSRTGRQYGRTESRPERTGNQQAGEQAVVAVEDRTQMINGALPRGHNAANVPNGTIGANVAETLKLMRFRRLTSRIAFLSIVLSEFSVKMDKCLRNYKLAIREKP
jgi:hypothetical protein